MAETRLTFIKLRQAFVKAPIFWLFNLQYYIWIETNKSGYAIGEIFSQLALNEILS